MRRTKTPWLTLAAGLCIASHFAQAAPQLTFTDKWADSGAYNSAYQYYYVKTVASFSVNISLPLNGVDLSELDANSQFTLAIGPSGNTTPIVSDTLGDAESVSLTKKSAKFAVTDPNTGNSVGSVTVSLSGNTVNVTGSATGDILGEELMFAGQTTGTPTTSTLNTATTGAFYEVVVSLDASDNGGGTFNYDNPYVPVTGTDKETEYNPPDMSGPYPLENGSVTGTGDFVPPKLSISSPAAGFKVYDANPVVDLTGLASDSEGMTNIQYFVNGDTNDLFEIDQFDDFPTNKVTWTAEVDLSQNGRIGSNLVTFVAQDFSGNQTTVSRSFYWIETSTAAVTVSPTGSGTVTGVKTGQVLQVGSGYAVKAAPASKAWIFSEWTDDLGDVLSSNANFEYIDTDGALTAVFETNYFNNTSLAGTYTGLFYDTENGVQLEDAGYITVTVTPTGGYSGKLSLATTASAFSFSGQLAESADNTSAGANFTIKVSKTEYLNVGLQIATDPVLADAGAGLMGGFVNAYSDAAEANLLDSAQIQGELSLYKAGILPGLYNVVISPTSTDPSQGPGGYSFGSATVASKTGAVKIALNLADGVSPAISFASFVAQDGTCPFYASLYSGKGVILGWMKFSTDGSGNMEAQPVNWVKMPVADKFYTQGFDATYVTTAPTNSGGLYVPPKAGTDIFGAGVTALTFEVDPSVTGSSLPAGTDTAVTFTPAKNTFADASKVTITLTATTGALKGSFFPAGSKTSLSFTGVVVDGAGYGFYSDAPKFETGPVWIGVPAPGTGNQAIIPSGTESTSSGADNTTISVSVPPFTAPVNSP